MGDLRHQMISVGRAARVMKMTIDELRVEAEKQGIDLMWGFHARDLIRLSGRMSAMSYDPERKTVLHAAMRTFMGWRDRDVAELEEQKRGRDSAA